MSQSPSQFDVSSVNDAQQCDCNFLVPPILFINIPRPGAAQPLYRNRNKFNLPMNDNLLSYEWISART